MRNVHAVRKVYQLQNKIKFITEYDGFPGNCINIDDLESRIIEPCRNDLMQFNPAIDSMQLLNLVEKHHMEGRQFADEGFSYRHDMTEM